MRPERGDAYARYMWPDYFNDRGDVHGEYDGLFASPFEKRGAKYTGRSRGHLRFVRRKLYQFVKSFLVQKCGVNLFASLIQHYV